MGKAGMRLLALSGAMLTLASACAPSPPPPVRQAPYQRPVALPRPSPYDTPTPYVTPRPSSQPAPPRTAADACGAAAHAYLVGKPRSEIPIPVDPSSRRVACSTCPVTEDFRPTRLNILYDTQSGLVTSVACG